MRRRLVLPYLRKAYPISERRACQVAAVNRSMVQYKSVKTKVPALRARINEIAAARVRYGYTRIHVLLRRKDWVVNRKRMYRIYREEGISMRIKTPRRRKAVVLRDCVPALAMNQTWSMDFMADNLRLLNVPRSTSYYRRREHAPIVDELPFTAKIQAAQVVRLTSLLSRVTIYMVHTFAIHPTFLHRKCSQSRIRATLPVWMHRAGTMVVFQAAISGSSAMPRCAPAL